MDQYETNSSDNLVKRVTELENLVRILKTQKDELEFLKFPWVGNLGNWYFDFATNQVTCNDEKLFALGFTRAEVPPVITYDFFTNRLHPDDYEPVMENMRNHMRGLSIAYEVTYRIKTKTNTWKWFYDRGVISRWSANGKPEGMAGIVFDVSEQKKVEHLLETQNEKLSEMANTDSLTGVLNRKALHESLEYEVKRVDRNKNPLSVFMLDIDNFKFINDTYGHLIGDDILVQVSTILKKFVRNTDIVGRFGGNEFLVVLPECNLENALFIANKVRVAVQEGKFESGIKITISGGVKEYSLEPIDYLLREVDQAMYQAKLAGKNRITAAPTE